MEQTGQVLFLSILSSKEVINLLQFKVSLLFFKKKVLMLDFLD